MAKMLWYTVKFSLIGIRQFELPQAIQDLQEVLSDFPNLRNVGVSLGVNNEILVQIDIEDLADLKINEVGERATEQILETLSEVLREPWDVAVHVVGVKASD